MNIDYIWRTLTVWSMFFNSASTSCSHIDCGCGGGDSSQCPPLWLDVCACLSHATVLDMQRNTFLIREKIGTNYSPCYVRLTCSFIFFFKFKLVFNFSKPDPGCCTKAGNPPKALCFHGAGVTRTFYRSMWRKVVTDKKTRATHQLQQSQRMDAVLSSFPTKHPDPTSGLLLLSGHLPQHWVSFYDIRTELADMSSKSSCRVDRLVTISQRHWQTVPHHRSRHLSLELFLHTGLAEQILNWPRSLHS